MSGFLTSIGTFFSTVIAWIAGGTVGEDTYTGIISIITANAPLLILVLAMPIIGFAIGLLRRLKNM